MAKKKAHRWTCPRCNESMSAFGKGAHVKSHWKNTICEDKSVCNREAKTVRSDGRVVCFLHFSVPKD